MGTFNYRYFKTCMRLVFDPRNRSTYAIDETLNQARLLVAWLEQERVKLVPEIDDTGSQAAAIRAAELRLLARFEEEKLNRDDVFTIQVEGG